METKRWTYFIEYTINLLMYFVIYSHWGCFECSEMALAYGSSIFRTFKTSLVPSNHQMHSRSCDFLYILRLKIFRHKIKSHPWRSINHMHSSKFYKLYFKFLYYHTGLSDASPGSSSGLDLSEFPALANRSRLESLNRVEGVGRLDSIGGVSAPPSSLASRPSYGVVSKPAEPPPDFSIHNEDFPALPGSNTFKSGTLFFAIYRIHVLFQ